MAFNIKCLGTISNEKILERNKYDINGVHHHVGFVNSGVEDSDILFPNASDGTKTYDSATGLVVQHADSATAFAAETATNKVIASRQDHVFLESFHEKISDKDVVYPLGNVQYGATTYEGIALLNNLVVQGYSAFGEWDTATVGYGVVWSTLSDADKITFLQDPDNNIYNDNGELIQVRYRVRVTEGLGDDWTALTSVSSSKTSSVRYDDNSFIQSQGKEISVTDFLSSTTNAFLQSENSASQTGTSDRGILSVRDTSSRAHNSLCFSVPIALVQRRNRGAYNPSFNPEGTSALWNNTGANSSSNLWYSGVAKVPQSVADCFSEGATLTAGNVPPFISGTRGNIVNGSARPDGKFYDAIYASDVQDLRMSSKLLPLKEIREKYKRMAIAGEVRGFEGVPFTKVSTITDGTNPANTSFTVPLAISDITNVGDTIHIQEVGGLYVERIVAIVSDGLLQISLGAQRENGNLLVVITTGNSLHSQANPTWTDIIGDPDRILATFPDGVEGQWIPQIPDGSSISHILNRKSLDTSSAYESTTNDGTSWVSNNATVDQTTNTITQSPSIGTVRIFHYETQAHFTRDDVNSEMLDLGGVNANMSSSINHGNLLTSSLLGKIATASNAKFAQDGYSLFNYSLLPTGKIGTSSGRLPEHNSFSLFGEDSVAVKSYNYLSSVNSVANLFYSYKEMIYDVTWGDNNQFEIINNQSTLTDDNGNTVLYGTASFDTQYFIVEE